MEWNREANQEIYKWQNSNIRKISSENQCIEYFKMTYDYQKLTKQDMRS